MAESVSCIFCDNPDTNLILFREETLKKCRTILEHRKEHNLKFKDVVLPADFVNSGYHRQCYKSFTGLMKKYYSSKVTTTEKSTPEDGSKNTTKKSSAVCSSTTKLNQQCIARQSSLPQLSGPTTSSLAGSIAIPGSTVIPVIVKPVLLNLTENNVQIDNIDLSFETNTLVGNNVSTDQSNITCIFCDQKTKKHRAKRLPSHSCDKKDLLPKLELGNENHKELINKIQNYSLSKIRYHHSCRLDFFYKASPKKDLTTEWQNLRLLHEAAFEETSAFIEENVIKNGRCYFLTYLHRHYMELFNESEEENSGTIKGTFTSHNLEVKLSRAFDKKIKFFTIQNKKIVAPINITAIDEQAFENLKDEDILHKAALLLRKSVMQAKTKKLPQLITAENLKEGEISVPQTLLDFYTILIAGVDRKRKNSAKCIREVKSFCEDVVYGVHDGNVKTSKHIMLGMSLKSLTSSRKIIDIIHKYGHCISYPSIEELETEVTYTSVRKSGVCPEKFVKSPDLRTVVTFDNFDRFVETKSVNDTLHDTVEIVYQHINPRTLDEPQLMGLPAVTNKVTSNLNKRRQRTFEAVTVDIQEETVTKKKRNNMDLSAYDG